MGRVLVNKFNSIEIKHIVTSRSMQKRSNFFKLTSLTIADAGLNWSSPALSLTDAITLAAVAAPAAGGWL